MNWKDIETITGLPAGSCDGVSAFHVFHFGVQLPRLLLGVKPLGVATSLAGALGVILRAFGGRWEIDPELGPFEDPDMARLVSLLLNSRMERTTVEDDLLHLGEVIEGHPELRLLVAWEADAPLHGVTFGIFVPR
jgi:hypothetical protein